MCKGFRCRTNPVQLMDAIIYRCRQAVKSTLPMLLIVISRIAMKRAAGSSHFAHRDGAVNVVLANAIGNGVAEDKSVYPFVTEMIRFTWMKNRSCRTFRRFYAVNPRNYPTCWPTCLSGWSRNPKAPAATACWWARRPRRRKSKPSAHASRPSPHAYIAQPTLCLSTCPTFVENGFAPRHIDLRPFVLSGKETRVVPGGPGRRRT